MEAEIQNLKDLFLEKKIEYVKVAITDIDGILRGKYMHVDKFLKSVKSGYGFCDVIFGWDSEDDLYNFTPTKGQELFTGWHTGYPDQKVRVELDSQRNIPFENNTLLFLSELMDGEVCPRGVLKKTLGDLESIGFHSLSALEYEFFLFKETADSVREKNFRNLKPLSPDMFGYSILRSSVHSDLYHEILDLCSSMDMTLEGLHEETGPGVLEAAISVDDSLKSADKAVIFKTFMKVLAQRRGLMATFMAKWSEKYPGQSGHIHCSLLDLEKKSVFSKENSAGMSKTMLHFLGGLQEYTREFSSLLAPTVNSYKRLCPGAWAPINMTWGKENRTVGFRVIEGQPTTQRIENRLGGADANPYLALAATLGAGFLGIKEKIEPTEPVKGTAYSLKTEKRYQVPRTLLEAAKAFKESDAARAMWGDKFVDHYASTRIWEYEKYIKEKPLFERNLSKISDWELKKYFEII